MGEPDEKIVGVVFSRFGVVFSRMLSKTGNTNFNCFISNPNPDRNRKPTESKTITETQTTTMKIRREINFREYKRGEILANWDKLFDSSVVYVSEGYGDLAMYYFPNAEIKPASDFRKG